MRQNTLLFARGIIGMALLMLVILIVGLMIDLGYGRYPLRDLVGFNPIEARQLNNLLARNLNQLLAVTFTTVAIAVPLTANMYSLKFLEFFIKDPVNAAVLTLVVFSALSNTWMGYSIKDDFVPVFQMHAVLMLVITCFSMLFPYLYYIFRFLHPNTLLARLEGEINADLRAAVRRPARAAAYRREVAEGLEHIANIAIRSIDRSDRNTAIESVLALDRVARAYWRVKEQLPPAWFTADPNFFLGFSSKAVDEFTLSRAWVEMKLFSQLRQVISAAIPRAHDVTDAIAKTLRRLGLEEIARRDVALREMVMEYFNTFARLALTRKDPRSVFSLFDHYRTYAAALNPDYPDFVLEIAFYFQYYGQSAREAQLPFLVEAIAHDLGDLVQSAWENGAPNREKLLQRFLNYDRQAPAPLPGVKKAQAILASFFLLTKQPAPAALIRQSFAGLDPAFVHAIRDDLLHIKREKYWEVVERRVHIDYVPGPQRQQLAKFVASLRPAARTRRPRPRR